MTAPAPALALSGEQVDALSSDPEVLATFGRFVRDWLGLSQLTERTDMLTRRLEATLTQAGWRLSDRENLLLALTCASESSPLVKAAAEVVPNHKTSFFRDVQQLQTLADWLKVRAEQGPERVRVLSAGCATGQELFTVAGLLNAQKLRVPPELVGMDVSEWAVEAARRGSYSCNEVENNDEAPPDWEEAFFSREGDAFRLRPELRALARFHVANLIRPHTWPSLGLFDAILCRNVLIYFSPALVQQVVTHLRALLKPGGLLVLGRAEAGVVSSLGFPMAQPAGYGFVRAQGDA